MGLSRNRAQTHCTRGKSLDDVRNWFDFLNCDRRSRYKPQQSSNRARTLWSLVNGLTKLFEGRVTLRGVLVSDSLLKTFNRIRVDGV